MREWFAANPDSDPDSANELVGPGRRGARLRPERERRQRRRQQRQRQEAKAG